MCVVALGAHLVQSVLAVLICVLVICEVGCLARTWYKRGVAIIKFQMFLILYAVTVCECLLWELYALARNKVN